MWKSKFLFSLYALLSAMVIWAQLIHNPLENILKPLLMPGLMLIYILLREERFKKQDYLLLLALFFSMCGDTFLMPYFDHFIAGLASFLLAHLFYLTLFIPLIKKPLTSTKVQKFGLLLGFVFYVLLLFLIINKQLANNTSIVLIVIIIIYASVLYSMFASALLSPSSPSYFYILGGASLFFLSDGLLAYNKFVDPIYLSQLWVMSTYTSAQALIMYGWYKRSTAD